MGSGESRDAEIGILEKVALLKSAPAKVAMPK